MKIKYAHRGLVLISVVSFTGLLYSFSFSRTFEEMFLFKLFRREEVDFTEFNDIKTAVIILSMTILYLLLYFSCMFLIRKKKISDLGFHPAFFSKFKTST